MSTLANTSVYILESNPALNGCIRVRSVAGHQRPPAAGLQAPSSIYPSNHQPSSNGEGGVFMKNNS